MTDHPRSSWNFRVLLRHKPEVNHSWIEITEVHYKDGKPVAYADNINGVASEVDHQTEQQAIAEMKWRLERMLEALDKPILDEREDFKS